MALSAATAGAAGFHPFLETFGSAAQPSFENRHGVAVDQGTGDVYVTDAGEPPSIKRYKADGTPDDFSALTGNAIDGKEGADATPQNGLGFSGISESQIAIDNSGGATDGNIYVTQGFPNLVNIFSSTGVYLGQLTAAGATNFTEACGVAVDPSGAVYVGDYSSGIHKFVPAANPPVNADHVATFTTTTNPCTLAAGAGPTAGFLFPAQYNGPISKIDSSTGEVEYSFSEGVTTVSVDPATGYVLALKGSEFKEFDASGAGSATTLSSDALEATGFGIGVRGSTGHVYVAQINSPKLEVFGGLLFGATVAIAPASGIGATEATLNGTVDPEGVALTECKFEWGPTSGGGYPNSVPCEQSVPADSNVHAVSADIGGLTSGGAQYRFRLVAKNANATETSATETFRVGATINSTAASVGIEDATLLAAITPGGNDTSYHFEWGLTSSYGNTTPTGKSPAGEDPAAVSAVLGGLAAGVTYHYRLVATNTVGTTQGSDQTFTTSAGPPQFPNRAYELVSQYPSGGIPYGFVSSTSEDGDHIEIGELQPLPGTDMPPPSDQLHTGNSAWKYQSDRTANGWKFYGIGLAQFLDQAGNSADGERYLFTTAAGYENEARLDPDDRNGKPEPAFESGVFEVYERQPDGRLVWISRDPRIPAGTPQTALGNATLESPGGYSMSVDGRTVVFLSQKQLTDDDTTPASGIGAPYRLYKWEDGKLSFIGKRPDGSVPQLGSILGTAAGVSSPIIQSAVSRDGGRVVFGAPREDGAPNGGAIYIQTDGQPTVEATKETGVPPLPPGQPYEAIYRGASADASRVFFTSSSGFTPDSGASATASGNADLYVYDINADKVRDLTPRLDGLDDPTVAPSEADSARVRGFVANSEDGKRAYFVADARYDVAPNPEGDLPSTEGRNLYMAELDGVDDPIKLRFVTALGPGDTGVWNGGGVTGRPEEAEASPDGSVLTFGSNEELTGQVLGGTNQLFVYDAKADTLACASCPSDGSVPVGNVNERVAIVGQTGQGWVSRNGDPKRWVATNGTVFFSTTSPLVPGDKNLVDDVYEYRSGQLRLVSQGSSSNASRFEGISRDGSTVFFETLDALLPWDEEPGVPKLYAARVGGGFPAPTKLPGCDLGAGACEGAGTHAPNTPGAGSAAFEGPDNSKAASAAKRCPKGKRKVRRKGKVRCAPKAHKRNAKHDRRASR
jgi:hypothetical protein